MTGPPVDTLATFEVRLVPNTYIACMTILVSYVWKSSWKTGKLLFIINRYLPFVVVSVSVVGMSHAVQAYIMAHRIRRASLRSDFNVPHLRNLGTQARGAHFFSIILFLGTAIPAAVFWQIELRSMEYFASDEMACSIVYASPITIWAYLMVAISETGILHIILVVVMFN
ncbi:hypothetical protein DFH09DRAFT_1114070 [Mycena vulgaris]|nr:hypothetical protein DFH09DRAFT_1114070 [Mycena vulgaris]